ncbi:hypothetical protein ACET3Z_005229 [Daucus carota]
MFEILDEMCYEDMATIMFIHLDHYLEEERIEAEWVAAICKYEWKIRFAGIMDGKLKKQKEEEDKVKDKAGPMGL